MVKASECLNACDFAGSVFRECKVAQEEGVVPPAEFIVSEISDEVGVIAVLGYEFSGGFCNDGLGLGGKQVVPRCLVV